MGAQRAKDLADLIGEAISTRSGIRYEIFALPGSDRARQILVLDGEVAVFVKKFVSRFELLRDPDPAVLCTPPMFIASDVLQIGRQDVRRRSLERRRPLLEKAIAGADIVLPVRRLDANGARAWKTVERRGLEGFVAKDPTALYLSGRTTRWLKVK